MRKEVALKLLAQNLQEGEVLFEHDDGWNAEIWGRGRIEGDFMISLERYTWKEGDDGGYNKNKILLDKVRILSKAEDTQK